MYKGVKFHSIFYRCILFILLSAVMVSYVIANHFGGMVVLFGGKVSMTSLHFVFTAVAILGIMALILSFLNWKVTVGKEGIYLKKIDLLVQWHEIEAVSHVWINESSKLMANPFLYNRKTLVIYWYENKPICVYNISLLALYVIKCYQFKLKTNLIAATLATGFNIVLNLGFLYAGFIKHFDLSLAMTGLWLGLYAIKSLVLPLVMVAYQNRVYGCYLAHATAYHKNSLKTINL